MTYIIKRSDGSTLTTVANQQIVKDAAPIALIGRGGVRYGREQSENFVHLLENFAADTPPANPMEGQFWYNKAERTPMVFTGEQWNPVSLGTNGPGGVTSLVPIPVDADTDILAFIAGGKIVAITSAETISSANLPETASVAGTALPVRGRFPDGIRAGISLATDPADYVFNGKVADADKAGYIGNFTPLGAVSVHMVGGQSIIAFVSSGRIGAVWSHAAIPTLPATLAIGDSDYAFATRFPTGLISGLTLAVDPNVTYGITGYATQQSVSNAITAETNARATAIDQVKTWVDANSATAQKITDVTASFTTATGTATLAQAINHIITTANAGGASAQEITALKAEFTNATGTSTLAQAVNYLKTRADAGVAASSQATALNSAFTNATGISNVATAVQTMWTKANDSGAVAGWGLELNAGGQIVGLQLNANSATKKSEISFRADSFKFWHPNTPDIIPFQIVGNKVIIKEAIIGDLTIGTEKLAPAAANKITVHRIPTSAIKMIQPGAAANHATVAFTKDSATSTLLVQVDIAMSTENSRLMAWTTLNLDNAGTSDPNYRTRVFSLPNMGSGWATYNTFSYTEVIEGVAAGPHSFNFGVFNNDGGSGSGAIRAEVGNIIITEVKK